MKYFIDTEFIEGFHKPLFGKKRHYIDMISIGIYCEDGREYYAISKEYNFNDASVWVKENVITEIYRQQLPAFKQQFMNLKTFHKYLPNSKSNKQIVDEIKSFVGYPNYYPINETFRKSETTKPEFYGYYSDYDWVLFCSLFGRMIDLPNGFPMYCIDLKQTLDEKVNSFSDNQILTMIKDLPELQKEQQWAYHEGRFEDKLRAIKLHLKYPLQTNEHNALSDAKWNYELYKFLQTI